jgi:hypothetical protein
LGATGLEALGGLYSTTAQAISIGIGGGVDQIALAEAMPSNNVTLGTNDITIIEPGTYEINYMVTVSTVLVAADLSAGVRINGATNFITSTFQTRTLSLTLTTLFEGITLVDLTAGDVIDLAVESTVDVSSSLTGGLTAYLIVKKISI